MNSLLEARGSRPLLEMRIAGLRAQITERFRAARESRAPKPDVKLLTSTLRAIRGQLATLPKESR